MVYGEEEKRLLMHPKPEIAINVTANNYSQ